MASSHRLSSGILPKALPQQEEDEDPIVLPPVDNSHLLERFKLTLIGRTFNTEGRSTELLLAVMPKSHIWDVEGRVKGFDLGIGRFQFDFDNEGDLQRVLNKRPCHINIWSLALERWKPNARSDFPNRITFWVQTKGLPREFWSEGPLKSMGKSLGEVISVDEKAGKIQVSVEVTRPLRFEKKAVSSNGEEHLVSFKYEKLHRFCFTCKLISHEERSCPHLTDDDRFRLRAERAEIARKEAEEEELFRVPQSVNNFHHPLKSDHIQREDTRRDRSFATNGRTDYGRDDRYTDHSLKARHQLEDRNPADSSRSSRSDRVDSYKKDYSREQALDKRTSRLSPSYYKQERDHKPVWQRLQSNDTYHHPRNRENFNSYHSDYRKRRHDESVATSSWRPRSARQQEGDFRDRKVQRLAVGDTKDARHTLDRKRHSEPSQREDPREILRKDKSPRRDLIWQPSLKNKDIRGMTEEDESRTITAPDLRQKLDSGRLIYKEKESSQARADKSSEKVSRSTATMKELKSSKENATLILTSNNISNMKGKEHQKKASAPLTDFKEGNANAKTLVNSPIEERAEGKSARKSITQEEELQIQKDLDEMKERHLALSKEERKTLQEEADELYALTMQQEEVDNDDLLDDVLQDTDVQMSGEHTVSEQIIPVSRGSASPASPSLSPNSKSNPPSPSRRPVKERIEIPKGSLSKSAHRRRRAKNRRRVSQSPLELPGAASKKRNILNNGSPKKRSEHKSQTLRSRHGKPTSTVPRTGVFPSSINKRTKSL